jgi:hypothetical protein
MIKEGSRRDPFQGPFQTLLGRFQTLLGRTWQSHEKRQSGQAVSQLRFEPCNFCMQVKLAIASDAVMARGNAGKVHSLSVRRAMKCHSVP